MEYSIYRKYAFTLTEAIIVMIMLGVIACFIIAAWLKSDPNEKSNHTLASKVEVVFEQTFLEILTNDASIDDLTRIKWKNDHFAISDAGKEEIFSELTRKYIQDITLGVEVDKYKDYFESNITDSVKISDFTSYYYLFDGVLVGFKNLGSCTNTIDYAYLPKSEKRYTVSDICSVVFYDVNGPKKPNELGKDQFIMPVGIRGIKYM